MISLVRVIVRRDFRITYLHAYFWHLEACVKIGKVVGRVQFTNAILIWVSLPLVFSNFHRLQCGIFSAI